MIKVLTTIFIFLTVRAESVSLDEKVYLKCYKQLTDKRVSTDSPILEKIRKKLLTGPKACLNLIQTAALDKNFDLIKQSEHSTKVLRNIQVLHNSWFKLYNLNIETQDHGVTNVMDANQMAYQYTASLLNSDTPYNSIFNTTETLWAKRRGHERNLYSNDKDIQGERGRIDGSGEKKWQVGGILDDPDEYGDVFPFSPKLVEFGEIIGLKKVRDHSYFKRLIKGKKLDKVSLTKNIFPGVFGSTAYLMLNLGHDNDLTDGGNKLHRRFANNFFSDFLCRSLPVISPKDIRPIKSSKLPFRNTKSCMGCHQTMDPLSYLTSNLEVFNAGEIHHTAYTFRGVYQHKINLSNNNQTVDSDNDFYRRSHSATLYFRDYRGKLINKKLKTPQDLGKELEKLDDPYLCTVSRYFDFLTGIGVDINNFKDIKEDHPVKEFLMSLTRRLKSTQNPISVFEMILKSPYYISNQSGMKNE